MIKFSAIALKKNENAYTLVVNRFTYSMRVKMPDEIFNVVISPEDMRTIRIISGKKGLYEINVIMRKQFPVIKNRCAKALSNLYDVRDKVIASGKTKMEIIQCEVALASLQCMLDSIYDGSGSIFIQIENI